MERGNVCNGHRPLRGRIEVSVQAKRYSHKWDGEGGGRSEVK